MKDKIYDTIFFIGGTFLAIMSLRYENGNLNDTGILILAIGICLIVFGFLRRNWRKKKS